MADAAAVSSRITLRRRSTAAPLVLDPALEIGAGGEARVLGVPGDPSLVAKLYRQPTLERARKLARMIDAPPALAGASLAWPVDLLTDLNGGRFAGFLMPRAVGPRLFELYNPVSRRKVAPLFDWRMLHRAGASLAAAFDALHAAGYVVGDVNESNILVSPATGAVTLVDADSFQVRDPVGGAIHRSGVGKAEFTPPELQGAHFSEVDRGPEHDRFGLAVLLFLLLMEGTHPFAMRFEADAEALPVEERIRRGLYPHASAFDGCRPPRMAPPIHMLHPALQARFLRCFVQGQADPSARPSAAGWREALEMAVAELRTCSANPRHVYGSHIPFCPWCHRQRMLRGRDPFPASVELARATDPVPAVRRGAAPHPWARPAPTPVPAPPPATPAIPQPPSQLATFLAGVQSGLPAWLAGPAALGHPLPWAAPALVAVLFAGAGPLRLMGMIACVYIFRSLFRGGLARVTGLTLVWLVALVLATVTVVGSSGADNRHKPILRDLADPAMVTEPPDPSMAPAATADGQYVYRLGDVDAAPELINPDEVARELSANYPPDLRDAGVTGTVAVTFTVTSRGLVEPGSIRLTTFKPGFSDAAWRVVMAMRFKPAEKGGRPVPVSLTLPVSFKLQD